MNNENGVTLLEVMSTMIIISILSGISVPIFQNILLRQEFNQEVRNMVNEIYNARSIAIKSNAHVVLCYSQSGYKIFVDDGRKGGVENDWIQQANEKVLTNVTFRKHFKIALDDSTFTGQRTRFSNRPGIKAGSIVLQGHDGQKTKVVLNVIGRVRVEKG